MLRHIRDTVGRDRAQYVDLERTLTTPERLLGDLMARTGFEWPREDAPAASPSQAFERVLAFLTSARTSRGEPALFLLDEVLELRTFESFPGLRGVTRRAVDALAASGNRFVVTTRYVSRALRLLRDASARFLTLAVLPIGAGELAPELASVKGVRPGDAGELARALVALADGRQVYVSEIMEHLRSDARRVTDPIAAMAELMSEGGALAKRCRHDYEMRLHRARGYGALKAILDILSREEPLTLTEIALRLRRTPGSTKDYLSWLEDVDLVRPHEKRYAISDPVLRLWIRLHCKPEPPGDESVAQEVQRYAQARLPAGEPPPSEQPVPAKAASERPRDSGIIEID